MWIILCLRDPVRRAEFGESVDPFLTQVLTFDRLYDDRVDLDPTYPALRPSGGESNDYTASNLDVANEDREIIHAPPGSELARPTCHCRVDNDLAY